MDGQMRLGDDDDSADAERVELVKDHVDDGRLRALRGFHHGRLHHVQTVDGSRVAVEQLEQQMSPQCLRFSLLPGPLCGEKLFRQNFVNCGAFFFALQGKSWRQAPFSRFPTRSIGRRDDARRNFFACVPRPSRYDERNSRPPSESTAVTTEETRRTNL